MTPPEPSIQSTRRKGTPFRLSLMLGWLLLLAYALWLLHNAAPLLASSPRPPLPELVARTIALPPVLTTPGVYLAAALSVLMLLLLIVLLALTVAPLPALEAHTAPGTQDTSEQPQVAPLTQPEPVETMEPTNVTDVSEAAEAAEASEVSEALSAAAADAHPSASEDVAPSHIEVEEVEEAVNATPAPTGDAADAPAGEARPAPPRGRQGVKSQRVFISSTSRDLYAHRQRVHDDLERMYQVPVDMAQFGAGGTDATTVSYTELATADIVVLIVAWRYGFIPAGEIHAVTELEYEEARRLKLPIYVYLADPATEAQDGPDALFPAETRQPEYAAQLAAFRAGLSDPNANTYGTFDSPADLSSRVGTALTRRLLREPLPGRLTPVEGRTLDRRSFRMGDDDAATFDYQIAPLQGAWEAATQALANASVEIGGKRGIIVLGEANAGKTRLALEALIATLPDWRTLIWSEAATSADAQKVAGLPDEQLVVFIDDLQRYAPMTQRGADGRMTALASNPAAILRDLISAITARTLVIVATCRSEDEQPTHAELSWLFDKLMEVRVPQFSANTADHDSQRVIAAFATHGATHLGDWDGSLGSLVLGLSTKRAQYEILATQRHPAVDVLRAMKLLTAAEVYQHTERRLRAVCAGVFHDQMIATRARAWEDAYRELLRLQFARIAEDASDDDDGAITLVIRKDTYFDADKVITDYPNPDDPGQLARHLAALQSVFVAQGDFDGLFSLGGMYYDHGDYVRALAAYDRALALRPDHADTWYNKGVALGQAGRTEEALAAYDRALALRPDDADTWNARAYALLALQQYDDALASIDHALAIEPENPDWWDSRGEILLAAARYQEAVAAYDAALARAPNLASSQEGRTQALQALGRDDAHHQSGGAAASDS